MVALILLRFVELVCSYMRSHPKHFIIVAEYFTCVYIYISNLFGHLILHILQYEEKF